MSDNIIEVHMINNKGYIWNANDWYVLRKTHRLLGSLIGSLPNTPRQEEQNGLPSLLLPEEVRFIVENGLGRAVEYPSFFFPPTKPCEFLRDQEQKQIHTIRKQYAFKKANDISKLVENAVLANGNSNCKEVLELNREVSKIKPYQFDTSVFTMIHLDELPPELIEVPLPELVFDLERTRYKVFKDLWWKGYYLTCGMKFGGDFLIYEGDPLTCHAKYIVNCADLDEQILFSHSRVSSITKKKMILAKIDGDSVKYLMYHLDDASQTVYKKPIHFLI